MDAPPNDWEQFHQLVLRDPALQERLRAALDWPEFLRLTLELGAQRGYHFSTDDVRATHQANRCAWTERWQ